MNKLGPFYSLWRAIGYFATGRLRFCGERVGDQFLGEKGQRFRVFRYVICKPSSRQPQKPGAVFIPHFHVANMSVKANILFSLISMWFVMGLPGFRSKCWMVDEATGDFSGYYEWDTLEDARNYQHSFAGRFMTDRSIPGSVRFNIYPSDTAPKPPSKMALNGKSKPIAL